jgi:hypothetical protein
MKKMGASDAWRRNQLIAQKPNRKLLDPINFVIGKEKME